MRRVILLGGISGSGKTSFVNRLGLTTLPLDAFYRSRSDSLPRLLGDIDWDHIDAYDVNGAVAMLCQLIETGEAAYPIYDHSVDGVVGSAVVRLEDGESIVAEGVFAPAVARAMPAEHEPHCVTAYLQHNRFGSVLARMRRDRAERAKPLIRSVITSVRLIKTPVDQAPGLGAVRIKRGDGIDAMKPLVTG